MSMITVKAAKSGEQNNEMPYEDTDMATSRKPSSLPYYFTLAVTTLLAYLKSASPNAAQEEQDPPNLALPQEKSAPPVLEGLVDYKKTKHEKPEPEAAEPARNSPINADAKSNIIDFPYRAALVENPIAFQTDMFKAPIFNAQIEPTLPPMDSYFAPAFNASDAPEMVPSPDRKKNRAPDQSGPVRLNDVMAGQAMLIGLTELLTQTTDAEGDKLTISNARVSSGSVAITDDGIVFSSNWQNIEGQIVIKYDVTDGTSVVQHTAYFQIDGRAPLSGTPESDILSGLDFADTIVANGGNDLIDARGGDDFISGGAGNDQIMGGSGNDIIRAGAGDDTVFGGDGDDLVSGETGDDRLFGNAGNDTITGNEGDDLIDGGDNNDHLAGNDGHDNLTGGAGDDVLLGGAGNDTLNDGSGEDIVQGEDGNDHLTLAQDLTADRVDGGTGIDTLDLSSATTSVDVNLTTNTVLSAQSGPDTITNFEIIYTGSGRDTLTGSSGADALYSGAGNDFVSGNQGDDLIDGGAGNDVLADGSGIDSLNGGGGDDRFLLEGDGLDDSINGGSGTDEINMADATDDIVVNMINVTISSETYGTDTAVSIERVATGSGNDLFFDSAAVLNFDAGAGSDTIVVARDASADTFSGGAGSDTLDLSKTVGEVVVDLINGLATGEEIGTNSIDGFESVTCGSGDDTVIIGAKSQTNSITIEGGEGNDSFEFIFESTNQAQTTNLVHQILDFMVGDQLVVADYQFRRVEEANSGSRIENVYAPGQDDAFVVRLRDIHNGEMHYAVIEVDRDKDDVFEFSIELFEGEHNSAPALPSLV